MTPAQRARLEYRVDDMDFDAIRAALAEIDRLTCERDDLLAAAKDALKCLTTTLTVRPGMLAGAGLLGMLDLAKAWPDVVEKLRTRRGGS